MNAVTKTQRKKRKPAFDRGQLNCLRGLSNSDLLEHWEVRELFRWQSTHFPNDSEEDLRQQAYAMFIQAKPLNTMNPDNFGGYLMTSVRHIVHKAHIWRKRKKRNLPTKRFAYRKCDGKLIEPMNYQRAAILFSHDEVTQIRATIWRTIRDEERREFIMQVLDGFLDGETSAETSRRLMVKDSKVHTAKRRLLDVLRD